MTETQMVAPAMPEYSVLGIENSDQVCWMYSTKQELESEGIELDEHWEVMEDGVCKRMNPVTRALIRSSLFTGINAIRPECIDEVQYRLELLYDSGLCLITTEVNGQVVPVPLTRKAIESHMYLTTTVTPRNKSAFDRYIREFRMKNMAIRNEQDKQLAGEPEQSECPETNEEPPSENPSDDSESTVVE